MAIPDANLHKVAFSSQFRYENISVKDNLTYNLGSGAQSIPHGLGYRPYARVWVEFPSTNFTPAVSSPYSPYTIEWWVDETNLYIEAVAGNEGSFGDPINIQYRIYKEPQT